MLDLRHGVFLVHFTKKVKRIRTTTLTKTNKNLDPSDCGRFFWRDSNGFVPCGEQYPVWRRFLPEIILCGSSTYKCPVVVEEVSRSQHPVADRFHSSPSSFPRF